MQIQNIQSKDVKFQGYDARKRSFSPLFQNYHINVKNVLLTGLF